MKKLALIFSIILLAFLHSCEEFGPDINLLEEVKNVNDTTYFAPVEAAVSKKVLIEEFTGVRCAQCPNGHKRAKEIMAANPNKVFVAGLHVGNFATPYNYNLHDFRLPEATSIENLLGATSYPSGAINRTLFSTENFVILNINKWENYVNTQLTQSTPFKIELEASYEESSRMLRVSATTKLTSNTNDTVNISVMILENNITDVQLTPIGIDSFYVHQHVLRTMLTPAGGNSLNVPDLNEGRVIVRNFEGVLPSIINDKEVEILVFIHKVGASSNKDILQVESLKLVY